MADVRYYLRGPETRIWPTNGKEDKNEKALNELRGKITANWPTFSSLSRRENSRQLRDPGSILRDCYKNYFKFCLFFFSTDNILCYIFSISFILWERCGRELSKLNLFAEKLNLRQIDTVRVAFFIKNRHLQ